MFMNKRAVINLLLLNETFPFSRRMQRYIVPVKLPHLHKLQTKEGVCSIAINDTAMYTAGFPPKHASKATSAYSKIYWSYLSHDKNNVS
jgi:hypothetical protein